MTFFKTATCAVLFGSLYTIFRKFQSITELNQHEQQFNEPIFQSFIIFLGMSTIVIFKPFMKGEEKSSSKMYSLLPDNKYIYIVPSMLDVLGTIVDTAGLYYTSVSVSQMLKGSVLFFTYLITLFYLKKNLTPKKHMYMVFILISLIVIGASNIKETPSKYQSKPLLGNILIIISQLLFSFMFVYEEKILQKYQIRVENAVFWEGVWGVMISSVILLAFSQNQTPLKSDVVRSCFLICNNWKLLVSVVLTGLCIGPFNYFGMSLTKQGSALQRCMICTMRMIVVWAISLIFQWQEFNFPQLLGYSILTWGIYKFNNCDPVLLHLQNAEASMQEQVSLNNRVQELQGQTDTI